MPSRRRTLVLLLLSIVAVLYSLVPIYDVVSISLMDSAQLFAHSVFPPTPNLHNFLQLFGYLPYAESRQVKLGIVNSMIVGLSVMTITMVAAVPAGYALGRLRMRGRDSVLWLILGARMIPPFAVLLPFYLYFRALNLLGTIPGLVIIQLSLAVPVVTWVLTGFFRALPVDVEMCARMDGCTRFQAFSRVLFPMASPGIAASAVVAFLFSWNDYLYSLTITSGTPAATLNAFISALGGPLLAAGAVVQIAVAVVLGGFLQKYITSLKIVDPGTVTL